MSLQIGVLLVLLVASGVWSILATGLIRGAVGLALVSVILSALLYEFGGPLAAVFELSVCAGLITVVLVSAISLTEHLSKDEIHLRGKERFKRFMVLPIIIIVVGGVLIALNVNINISSFAVDGTTVNDVLWKQRAPDLFGQITMIITGVFGVVVLFKERSIRKTKNSEE